MVQNKIYINNSTLKKLENLKKQGKKIVLCHGSFDLVHPGHLNHFQEAKSYGDILIVTITADNFIKKNIHSPFYNQEIRRNFLQNLKIVDYVFIVKDKSAIPSLEKIKPHFYCKGIEYKTTDNIGNLKQEKKILNKNKGKLLFLGKNVQSSSKLISNFFFNLENKNLESLLKKINFARIDKLIDKIKKLKVLVIGETIIDQYNYVKTAGVSPKSNTLSCIEDQKLCMPGGSLATYKFLSSFIKNIKHISIINKNLKSQNDYYQILENSPGIINSKNYEKLVKKKIVEGDGNGPLNKIITINEFKENNLTKKDENLILSKLKTKISNFDLVIAQDFGHGLFTDKIINLIQKRAKILSINVQTNSINYGYNIIDKKFGKTDIFSLDERELQLVFGKKRLNYKKSLKKLSKTLSAKKGFLTCGGKFSLLYSKNKFMEVPILNKKALDTMGAGDIFHGMASVISSVSNDDHLNLFISQIAGAHAVEIIGNSDFPKFNQIINTLRFYKKI